MVITYSRASAYLPSATTWSFLNEAEKDILQLFRLIGNSSFFLADTRLHIMESIRRAVVVILFALNEIAEERESTLRVEFTNEGLFILELRCSGHDYCDVMLVIFVQTEIQEAARPSTLYAYNTSPQL
jgi:hypothetical protein